MTVTPTAPADTSLDTGHLVVVSADTRGGPRVAEATVSAMIGGNAVRAYGMDADALRAVVAGIAAPTYEELQVALSDLPDETERGRHSFRVLLLVLS